ncbi:unnamed protein product [Cylicostephanus goldi]|uniref:Uncharacterized protein n=1 Tax=Cylicostephanus goldi TaxID=71465 RepID=A0A3P6RYL5_CYLGO|nr:unnamed protein product [Cylicostephanus goldi]
MFRMFHSYSASCRYLLDSYSSQYPAPQRTREYSTPPSREYSRPPSRSGSFISFLEYSGSKNGELSRNASRTSIYDAPLSRSYSRPDLYVGAGRLSRVDSYVRDLHTPYEYEMPSTYDRYRSSSRSGGYSTMSGYTVTVIFQSKEWPFGADVLIKWPSWIETNMDRYDKNRFRAV